MISREQVQALNGKIVLIEWGGASTIVRMRVEGDHVTLEGVWSLRPHVLRMLISEIDAIEEIPDVGNAPDASGRVSPHAAWEIFEHVLRSAMLEPKCRLGLSSRDDEVVIENALGHRATLMFHAVWPNRYMTDVTWEGDVSWVRLSGMTREEAVKAVLYTDPADLPTIETKNRLSPP